MKANESDSVNDEKINDELNKKHQRGGMRKEKKNLVNSKAMQKTFGSNVFLASLLEDI